MYQSKKEIKAWRCFSLFFLLPAIVLSVLLLWFLCFLTFRYSFTDWSGLGEYNNIGFQNFQNLMSDPIFWDSIKTTFIWVLLLCDLFADYQPDFSASAGIWYAF